MARINMSYEEFERIAMDDLRGYFNHDYDRDYPEKVRANGCIRAEYESRVKRAELFGEEVRPDGFAYMCWMLWDDLPTTYDEYKASEAEFQQRQQADLAAAFGVQQ